MGAQVAQVMKNNKRKVAFKFNNHIKILEAVVPKART